MRSAPWSKKPSSGEGEDIDLCAQQTPLRKAAFLDRDGTVTKGVAYYLTKPSQVELEVGAAEAIRLLRRNDYLIVVITNQAGVARGLLTEQDLAAINDEMLKQLAAQGAQVEGVYCCPHHPEGFIERYSIECECRKPKPGLLLRAAQDLGIDLNSSVMVGDAERDVLAGMAVGCETFLVNSGRLSQPTVADHCVKSLLEAARMICGEQD
jgi:D-glycero-D-manno-heptose 1,7-bisphosphate phosphatase